MGIDKGIINAIISHREKICGPHFIFSANAAKYPAMNELNLSHDQVMHHLNNAGYDAHQIWESYGTPRTSIVVYDVNSKQADDLHNMAARLGQEHSIYSTGTKHELRYHHGPNVGKSHYGEATTWHDQAPDNFFVSLPGGLNHFTHHVDSNNYVQTGPIEKS